MQPGSSCETGIPDMRIDDYLNMNVTWSRTGDPVVLWRAEVGTRGWAVRINDFPEEHLYTLIVGEEEVGDFDDWPRGWIREDDATASDDTVTL